MTYIWIPQETVQVVWYSNLLKNFPEFVVIYTVKGFVIINKAEVCVFLEFFCFFDGPMNVGNFISGPLPFLNPALSSGSSRFPYCWSLAWRIFSITLLVCEISKIVWQFEHSLALPFFGIGMRTDFFQSCGHCWVFQICWPIKCSTLPASPFRIWNSSTGIPSPPLVLFLVVLPKAHLTAF